MYAELPNADKQDVRMELLLALAIHFIIPALVRNKLDKDSTLAAFMTVDILLENNHNNIVDNQRCIDALEEDGAFDQEINCINEKLERVKEKSVSDFEMTIRSRTIDRLKYLYINNKSASFTEKEIVYKSDVASYSFGTKVGKMLDEFSEVMNSVAPLPHAV